MVNTCAGCFLEFLLDWLGFLLPLVIGLASSPLMQLVQPAGGNSLFSFVERSCSRLPCTPKPLSLPSSICLGSISSAYSACSWWAEDRTRVPLCVAGASTHTSSRWIEPGLLSAAPICVGVFSDSLIFFPNATTYGVLKFCRNFLIHENAIICSCSTNCY